MLPLPSRPHLLVPSHVIPGAWTKTLYTAEYISSTPSILIVIEILMHQLRISDKIKGLKIRSESFKVQAFTDDLLVVGEDPQESIKTLMKQVKKSFEKWQA